MIHCSRRIWLAAVSVLAATTACERPTPVPVSEGYVPIGSGLRLHYRAVGNGPDTVVIPAAAWWPRDIEQLATGRTLLFYDPRGRGRSDAVPDTTPIGIPQELEDLERLRQHFGIGRMSLMGWSYLGAVVVLYAAQHPDHVNRLVQVGPIVPRRAPYWDRWLADYAARAPRGGAITRSDTGRPEAAASDCRNGLRATVIPQLGDTSFASVIADAVGCALPNEHPTAIGRWFQRMSSSFGDWDWRGNAATVDAPVLTVQGTRDNIPLEASQEWVGALRNARLLRLEGVGHYPMFERPEAFVRALRAFFDGAWPEGSEQVQSAGR